MCNMNVLALYKKTIIMIVIKIIVKVNFFFKSMSNARSWSSGKTFCTNRKVLSQALCILV